MTSAPSRHVDQETHIEHCSLGNIVFAAAPTPHRPQPGRVSKSGRRVIAVLTYTQPSSEVLDRLEALRHPNLVRWYGLCEIDGDDVAITSLATGGSLAERNARRQLNEPEIARVILSISAALGALAEHGLCHGDLSPDNIVLDADGRPLLADLHDCVIADSSPLDKATLGFEGGLGNASAQNDLSGLARLVEFLARGSLAGSSRALQDALERLERGESLSDAVRMGLVELAAERVEILENVERADSSVDMVTRRFGPRPDHGTGGSSQPGGFRVLVAAACLSAVLTCAVIWAENEPPCETPCDAQQR
jgi:serine/threonine protein kinase